MEDTIGWIQPSPLTALLLVCVWEAVSALAPFPGEASSHSIFHAALIVAWLLEATLALRVGAGGAEDRYSQ